MMTEDSNVAVNNNEEVEPTSSRGRVRKAVQTFQFVPQQVDDTEDFVPPTGPGTALRELPGVEETV
jgi:hypothetical protein